MNYAVSTAQKIIDELIHWGYTAGLKFNPSKTVAILFTRKHKIIEPKKIAIGFSEITYSKDTRYLGVQLDHRLDWNIQFNHITKRAKQYIMTMMAAVNKYWGPKPKLIRWIYTAIIRPRITYSAFTWGHSTQTY